MAKSRGPIRYKVGPDGYLEEFHVLTEEETRQRVANLISQKGIAGGLENASITTLEDWVVALDEMIEDARDGASYRLDSGAFTPPYKDDLRFLLQERLKIADHLMKRAREQGLSDIKDAVSEKVADPDVAQELIRSVSEVGERQEEVAAGIEGRNEALAEALQRVEIDERRWQMRKSLLEREPAAVLIGAVLLVVMTLALLIAMFTHTSTPEIVSSAFLLILGFFFGQTAGGKRGRE